MDFCRTSTAETERTYVPCAARVPSTAARSFLISVFSFLAVSLSAGEPATQTPDLVGHWTFDEGDGTTANDSSGRGNAGALIGGARWVPDRHGGHAVSLDGEDDHVRLPNMRTVARYPFTFVAWVRTSCRDDREMTAVIQENDAKSGQRVQLYLSSSGKPKWNVRNGSAEAEIVHPVDIRDGGWHFLAGVSHAQNQHELYVDATPVRTSSIRVPLFAANSATIGNWMGNRAHSKWFEGDIDDVRIYDRALSADEIEYIRGPLGRHRLTVRGGTGGGDHAVGDELAIEAEPVPTGKVFAGWLGDTVGLADAGAASTTYIMPAREATLMAEYQECGETLYNGIRLPKTWPPRLHGLPDVPTTPPYLLSPPAVIPIDVGRQLLVDDFLIEATTLTRTCHRPTFYEGNPVLTPEKPWEQRGRGPMAIPHSGGVCFDLRDRLFKMWYIAGYQEGVGLVHSEDGLRWRRPAFDHVEAGTNLVCDRESRGSTVWLHETATDPNRRFVMFSSRPGAVWFSGDGVHWGEPVKVAGPMSDRTTLFRNPFRNVWVYSIKTAYEGKRARRYWETPQLAGHPKSTWSSVEEPTLWTGSDSADTPREDLAVPCQLYDLDCVAYESLLLGMFIIWRGDYRFDAKTDDARRQNEMGRPKQNSACIGFSRDGFHWHRPDRRVFLPKSDTPGAWNWGNSQTAAKSPLIVGDKLFFYVAGRAGLTFPGNTYQDAGGCTGLAFLRRDGFASMDAGPEGGVLTTRPLVFSGRYLFVNADSADGDLRVGILGEDDQELHAYRVDECTPVSTDKTSCRVTWGPTADLAPLSGRPVRFRFHLRNGQLYAFWVSPDTSGASYGYVAGGGPGFTSNRDTVGTR